MDQQAESARGETTDREIEDRSDELATQTLAYEIGSHAVSDVEGADFLDSAWNTRLMAEAAVTDESPIVFDGPESGFGGDDLANVVGPIPARVAPPCDRLRVRLRECPNLHLRMLTLRTSVRNDAGRNVE